MDFSLSSEQIALQDSVRRFATSKLPDVAAKAEADDEPPGRDVMKRFAEMGLLGVNLPTEYGGGGFG